MVGRPYQGYPCYGNAYYSIIIDLYRISNAFADRFKMSDEKLDYNFKSLNDTIKNMILLQNINNEKRMIEKNDEEMIKFYLY